VAWIVPQAVRRERWSIVTTGMVWSLLRLVHLKKR
jgi:hypothetical protein